MTDLAINKAYDQSHLATVPMQDEASCFAALDAAHRVFLDRDRWLPLHDRIAILERAARLVEERTEPLARTAAQEGGKPLTDSLVEVKRGVTGIRSAIAALHHLAGSEVPMGLTAAGAGRVAYTYREPRGVLFAVSAFNHPFNLIVHQAIPALATGCPVLVKPAKATPLSCEALMHILYEAGLPAAWCRMVLCDNDVAAKLVADRRLGFFSFIGSARVGWRLRSQLAPGVGCALEHGGVAPAIVDETADLDDAIPLLTKGGFYHAGQVCVSVQRIYVHDSIAKSFTARFVDRVTALRVGDPEQLSTEVGPLIHPREVDRVASWVQEAIAAGATCLTGGTKLSATCYAPTVLWNPPEDAKVTTEEIFGPVVAVYPYRTLDEAIARANAPDAYFQASIFTQRLEAALYAHRRLRGMAVMVNDHTAFRVDWMPFGGHLSSGIGAGGIGYTMRDLTLERMVVIRSPTLS